MASSRITRAARRLATRLALAGPVPPSDLERLEARLATLQATVDELRRAMEESDPALTREIVEAVRSDVDRLVIDVGRAGVISGSSVGTRSAR